MWFSLHIPIVLIYILSLMGTLYSPETKDSDTIGLESSLQVYKYNKPSGDPSDALCGTGPRSLAFLDHLPLLPSSSSLPSVFL